MADMGELSLTWVVVDAADAGGRYRRSRCRWVVVDVAATDGVIDVGGCRRGRRGWASLMWVVVNAADVGGRRHGWASSTRQMWEVVVDAADMGGRR